MTRTRGFHWTVVGIAGGLTLSLAAVPAHAADAVAVDAAEPAVETVEGLPAGPEDSADDGWQFAFSPYLWMSGMKGDMRVFPDLPTVETDLKFSDIFSNLKFGAMGTLQARKGKFVMIGDVLYVDLDASKDVGIRDPQFLQVELGSTTFLATAAAGYRVVDQDGLALDLLGGIRVSAVDTEVTVTGPLQTRSADSSKTWVDPIIGAHFIVPFAESWRMSLYGDIGGFGVSSKLTWQLAATIQYQIGRNWFLVAGWKHYSIDYDKDDFIYDVTMSGPLIGATVEF